jgi:hypothetical protein
MTPDWAAKPVTVPYASFGDPQTLNLYTYVENGPVNRVDADGHRDYAQSNSGNPCYDTASAECAASQNAQKAGQAAAKTAQNQVQTLVDAQNAAMANSKYAPNTPTAGTTHCSEAACDIAQHTGANTTGVLSDAKGNNYPANTQINNLANPKNGYQPVTPDQAQALANKGVLVFATQHGADHGHIASVRPEGVSGDQPRGSSGPILANVGLFNGVAHQSAVFNATHGEIVYYAPNQ